MSEVKQYKLIYVGGAIDHIILPIIKEFFKNYGDDFLFISTYEKAGLRTDIGYSFAPSDYPFVKTAYTSKKDFRDCKKLIKKAKVVIYQRVEHKSIIRGRLFTRKITFKCTERLYKKKTTPKNFLRRVLGTIYHYHLFNKHNKYVLCMGGYAAADLKKAHLFKGKMLTWGYFTDTTKTPYEQLLKLKEKDDTNSFCWVGRFVPEKQPMMVLELAKFLKTKNINFKIKMCGYGSLIEDCNSYVSDNNLTDCVDILGPLPLKEKEELMNSCKYFLFTSNREEGWGAVVNEAMGSACVCFAPKEAGSPKTLINDLNNGYLYSSENQAELNSLVLSVLSKKDNEKVQKNAYESISSCWNTKVAVKRLCKFIDNLLDYNQIIFEEYGPCSEAK